MSISIPAFDIQPAHALETGDSSPGVEEDAAAPGSPRPWVVRTHSAQRLHGGNGQGGQDLRGNLELLHRRKLRLSEVKLFH